MHTISFSTNAHMTNYIILKDTGTHAPILKTTGN